MNMNRMDRRKKSNQKLDLLTIILGGAFIIATLVTAFFAFRFVKENIAKTDIIDLPGVSISSSSSDDAGQNNEETADNRAEPPKAGSESNTDLGIERVEWDGVSRVNILIMGLDYRDWETGETASRTDSMMVLTLDPATMTAGLLSIPRDLWVNVPGFEQNKINTAYFLGETNHLPGGGPALATQTVEEFLGIDIQYYAQIDFNTFVQFVDFMGGVKFDIVEPITLEMPGGHKEKLEPGRYNLSGGLARAQRQQQLLLAIRDQLFRPDIQGRILSNPQGVWDIFSQGIRTNIPLGDAFALGMMALELDREDIIQRVISAPEYVTFATSPDGLQVLKPITNKIRILRDELFTNSALTGPVAAGGNPTQLMLDEAATVAVYNGSVISGLAGATQEYLVGLGVDVVEIGNSDLVPSTTVYDYTGNPYTLQYLVTLFDIENTRIFNSFDPDSTVDVAVILGSEWVVPTGQ
jgi:LCP family protein required for cell wall assembly